MSDSTAHNLGAVEEVCKDLNIKEVSGSLLCNVHQLMMFDWKMKEFCQKLHDCPSGEKLEDCFLVDIGFQRESFPIQAIKYLPFSFFFFFATTSLLSHENILDILVSLSEQKKM